MHSSQLAYGSPYVHSHYPATSNSSVHSSQLAYGSPYVHSHYPATSNSSVHSSHLASGSGGDGSHLAFLNGGALAELVLEGQQELLVGLLHAQGLTTPHLWSPLPGHH